MIFYKCDQFEVEKEGDYFVVAELIDGQEMSCSIALKKEEVNPYLEDNGYEPININKPQCKLIGQDGNIFNLMAIVRKTLVKCNMDEKAEKMIERVTSSKSYDEALRVFMDYVEII